MYGAGAKCIISILDCCLHWTFFCIRAWPTPNEKYISFSTPCSRAELLYNPSKAHQNVHYNCEEDIFLWGRLVRVSVGIFGLVLGWIVSLLINLVINSFMSKQGIPYTDYFSFPWWLCIGAVLFGITVSLVAGIYPTIRAAKVDPVVALRHD